MKSKDRSRNSLLSLFPIVLVDNDISVNQRGDISILYELSLPEIYTPSQEDYVNMRAIIGRAITALPSGSVVQKLDFFFQEQYKPVARQGFVLNANEEHFAERPLLRHASYLTVSFSGTGSKKRTPMDSGLTSAASEAARIADKRLMEAERLASTFAETLKANALLSVRRLNTDDIIELLYRYTTLDFTGKVDSISANIKADTNGLTIGSQVLNVVRTYDFPLELQTSTPIRGTGVDASITHPLCLGFGKNHIVSQTFKVVDTSAEIKRMEKTVRDCSLVPTAENNTIAENIHLSAKELIETQRELVEVDYSILLFDLSRKEVKESMDSIVGKATTLDFKCNNPAYLTEAVFFNCVPGNAMNSYDTTLMPVDAAMCLMNLETTKQQTGVNGCVFCDKVTGVPTEVDLWHKKLENKNVTVIGGSGGGKSFLINYVTHQEYQQGVHTVCIDIGGSYKRNCQALGGRYIEYTLENPINFNPFTVRSVRIDTITKIEEGETESTNILFLRSLLFKL